MWRCSSMGCVAFGLLGKKPHNNTLGLTQLAFLRLRQSGTLHFNCVRFFRATRGKTAHITIGTYHAAGILSLSKGRREARLWDAEQRNCVTSILVGYVGAGCARATPALLTLSMV